MHCLDAKNMHICNIHLGTRGSSATNLATQPESRRFESDPSHSVGTLDKFLTPDLLCT